MIGQMLERESISAPPDDIKNFTEQLIKRLSSAKVGGVRRVQLHFPTVDEITDESLPHDARVVADISLIREIFGYDKCIKWSDMLELVRASDPL